MVKIKDRKIALAKASCKNLIRLIDMALKKIKSSSRWGVLDVVGGNVLTSAIKRRKISKYRNLINEIDKETKVLNESLRGLSLPGLNSLGSFNTGMLGHLVDIFADHFVVDIFTQLDISKTKKDLKAFKKEVLAIEKSLNRI